MDLLALLFGIGVKGVQRSLRPSGGSESAPLGGSKVEFELLLKEFERAPFPFFLKGGPAELFDGGLPTPLISSKPELERRPDVAKVPVKKAPGLRQPAIPLGAFVREEGLLKTAFLSSFKETEPEALKPGKRPVERPLYGNSGLPSASGVIRGSSAEQPFIAAKSGSKTGELARRGVVEGRVKNAKETELGKKAVSNRFVNKSLLPAPAAAFAPEVLAAGVNVKELLKGNACAPHGEGELPAPRGNFLPHNSYGPAKAPGHGAAPFLQGGGEGQVALKRNSGESLKERDSGRELPIEPPQLQVRKPEEVRASHPRPVPVRNNDSVVRAEVRPRKPQTTRELSGRYPSVAEASLKEEKLKPSDRQNPFPSQRWENLESLYRIGVLKREHLRPPSSRVDSPSLPALKAGQESLKLEHYNAGYAAPEQPLEPQTERPVWAFHRQKFSAPFPHADRANLTDHSPPQAFRFSGPLRPTSFGEGRKSLPAVVSKKSGRPPFSTFFHRPTEVQPLGQVNLAQADVADQTVQLPVKPLHENHLGPSGAFFGAPLYSGTLLTAATFSGGDSGSQAFGSPSHQGEQRFGEPQAHGAPFQLSFSFADTGLKMAVSVVRKVFNLNLQLGDHFTVTPAILDEVREVIESSGFVPGRIVLRGKGKVYGTSPKKTQRETVELKV